MGRVLSRTNKMEGIYMVKNKILLGLLSIFAVFLMAACGNGETQPNEDEESQSTETESSSDRPGFGERHLRPAQRHRADRRHRLRRPHRGRIRQVST